MSDLPRDPVLDDGNGDDPELDQPEDLETEVEEAESGDEPEAAVEDEEPEIEPRQTRRQRGRAFGEQIRDLTSQLDDTRRQLAEVQRRPAAPTVDPQAQARADQEFWASLDLMTPAEAHRAVYQRARNEFAQQFSAQQFNTQETLDRQAYDAAARTSRVHQQYRQKVDDLVAAERNRGNIVSREVALRYLLGEDAITRAGRVVPGQRRAAASRIAGQTVRPASARGDVARGGTRRDQGADDEAMLRNTRVADI